MNPKRIPFLLVSLAFLTSPLVFSKNLEENLPRFQKKNLNVSWQILQGKLETQTLLVDSIGEQEPWMKDLPAGFEALDVNLSAAGNLLVLGYFDGESTPGESEALGRSEQRLTLLCFSAEGDLLWSKALSNQPNQREFNPFVNLKNESQANPRRATHEYELGQENENPNPDHVIEVVIVYIPASDSGRP